MCNFVMGFSAQDAFVARLLEEMRTVRITALGRNSLVFLYTAVKNSCSDRNRDSKKKEL